MRLVRTALVLNQYPAKIVQNHANFHLLITDPLHNLTQLILNVIEKQVITIRNLLIIRTAFAIVMKFP
jgi:hypothetical protein